jgi:hypothetical protein
MANEILDALLTTYTTRPETSPAPPSETEDDVIVYVRLPANQSTDVVCIDRAKWNEVVTKAAKYDNIQRSKQASKKKAKETP